MSLTNGHAVYASLSDRGFQKFVRNVYIARPHYFHYATQTLGGGTSDISSVPTITLPGGANAGLDYSLDFVEPQIFFFPEQFFVAPPSPLPLKLNQFGIYERATVCILSSASPPSKICGDIEIWALGHPTVSPSGSDALISLRIDQALVSGAGNLDDIIQYILQKLLNTVLSQLQLSANLIAQSSFNLTLDAGPEISDAQIKIWGAIK